ncbi:hypothetical protein FBQ95_17130 [Chloroflexi bacterium CFX3]|nr:hypothetical protein [Chloroflexi bacterium CFX3]
MPNFNTWGGIKPLGDWRDDINRAYDTARLIAEQPTNITLIRAGATLAAQTVRLERSNNIPAELTANIARVAETEVVIIGYRGHPTIADTNVRRGDRFVQAGQTYEVMQVDTRLDRVFAHAKVQ